MIERKYTFQHMKHSSALEKHAAERVDKIEKLLESVPQPKTIEFFFKANAHGTLHEVDVHLTNKEVRTEAHASDPDAYRALDEAMDKIVHSVKKAREIMINEHHKVNTPKKDFFKN